MGGNVLPIEVITNTPTQEPPGGKGIVFKVSGGVAYLYVWDSSSSQWILKSGMVKVFSMSVNIILENIVNVFV
jgi:hypothetical protein